MESEVLFYVDCKKIYWSFLNFRSVYHFMQGKDKICRQDTMLSKMNFQVYLPI